MHYTRVMQLTERQKKTLRRLGHALNPVVALGNHGLTDAVVAEMDRALTDHELIKVRARVGERDDRNVVLTTLAERTGSALVQRIGNEWQAFYGIEYTVSARYAYTNAELPFLPGSRERNEFPAFHVMFSRRW